MLKEINQIKNRKRKETVALFFPKNVCIMQDSSVSTSKGEGQSEHLSLYQTNLSSLIP